MLELLKSWRQTTQFSGDNDWVFASPVKLGRARFLPLGSEGVSAGGNPGGHWETRDALTSTQLSFMAGRGRNCDYGPAEVDVALGYP
jgi:hypothetical protein